MSVAPYEVRHSTHQPDGPSSGNYGAKPALACSTLNRVMNCMFFSSSATNKTTEKFKKEKKRGRRILTSKVKSILHGVFRLEAEVCFFSIWKRKNKTKLIEGEIKINNPVN